MSKSRLNDKNVAWDKRSQKYFMLLSISQENRLLHVYGSSRYMDVKPGLLERQREEDRTPFKCRAIGKCWKLNR